METAYFYLPQFENELMLEFSPQAEITKKSEGLIMARGGPDYPVWAQQIFRNVQHLRFESIGEAAKKLKMNFPGPWVNSSISHHRRASLISEKLRMQKPEVFDFQDKGLHKKTAGFSLLDQTSLIFSLDVSPNAARGEIQFNETSQAPSRAYLKLWEFFSIYGRAPRESELCLDFGSHPGGWTWVLAELGARVLSVDKAPLESELRNRKNIINIKKDAFKIVPSELTAEFGKADWFFSDIICKPQRLLELIEKWRSEAGIKNFVCTVKFKGKTDVSTLKKLLQIPGSRAVHLYHNKHEVTWFLLEQAEHK